MNTTNVLPEGPLPPSASDFIKELERYDIFGDDEIDYRKFKDFEFRLGLFSFYGDNILPIGIVGSTPYYLHVYCITPGSTNDSANDVQSPLRRVELDYRNSGKQQKHLLVIGRLIIGKSPSYYVVAMDPDHQLLILRASDIGDDEKDNEQDFCSESYLAACDTENLGARSGSAQTAYPPHRSEEAQLKSALAGSSSVRHSPDGGRTNISFWGLDGSHDKDEKHVDDRGSMGASATVGFEREEGGGGQDGEREIDIEQKRSVVTELQKPGDNEEYQSFRFVVLSQAQSHDAEIFGIDGTDKVFRIGKVGILATALQDPTQQIDFKGDAINDWSSKPVRGKFSCPQ